MHSVRSPVTADDFRRKILVGEFGVNNKSPSLDHVAILPADCGVAYHMFLLAAGCPGHEPKIILRFGPS
jgi:hypothetical protein